MIFYLEDSILLPKSAAEDRKSAEDNTRTSYAFYALNLNADVQ